VGKLTRDAVLRDERETLNEILGIDTGEDPGVMLNEEVDTSRETEDSCYPGRGLVGRCATSSELSNDHLTFTEGRFGVQARPDFDAAIDLPPGLSPKPMACLCFPLVTKAHVCLGVVQFLNKRELYGAATRFLDSDITFCAWFARALAARLHPTSTIVNNK